MFNPKYLILDYINSLSNKDIIYYEIGIANGETVTDVAKLLNNKGKIFVFSRHRECTQVINSLFSAGYHNIFGTYCSDDKTYSGYHFDIANGMAKKDLPSFDIAYLDGGHVFHLDAPTTCMLKELCKLNGIIFFDDYNWSLKTSQALSPTTRSKTLQEYDSEQINAQHIKMICNIFMDTDYRFKKIHNTQRCVSYMKVKEHG